MKKKTFLSPVFALSAFWTLANADPVTVNQLGVGARAYALANNYVALSNDMSGIFWNPAALSFLPVREIQGAFDILDNRNSAHFGGASEKSDVKRPRFSNVGFLASIPASRGGLTFAGGVQTPYIFDDNPTFHGTYIDVRGQKDSIDQDFIGFGGLTHISGAFGLQVAQGFSVGAAVSFIIGSEEISKIFYRETNDSVLIFYDDNYIQTIDRGYLGYDIRIGFYYLPIEMVRIGMRLSLPQQIWFDEDYYEEYPGTSQAYSTNPTGQLLSSYSGALGVAVKIPFLTISSEVRARAPYDLAYPGQRIPTSSPAAHMKMGAGIGLEVPLLNTKWVARGGFSWDEYDPFVFVRKYNGENISWDTEGLSAKRGRNLWSGGLAYVEKNWCLEGAYGYQSWKLDTQYDQNIYLKENYNLNRFTLSLSIRY